MANARLRALLVSSLLDYINFGAAKKKKKNKNKNKKKKIKKKIKKNPTMAATIVQSSRPKARTTRARTKHRRHTVTSDRARKTEVAATIASLRPLSMVTPRHG